jgi:cytochrome c oxidase subunit III
MSSAAYPPVNPPARSSSAAASSSGVWVALFAITMTFAAFTSAMLVRQGSADWNHLHAPPILFANTVLLLLSSLTLETARRTIAGKSGLRPAAELRRARIAIALTLLLGLVFVAGQYLAWHQLAAQGLWLATNPNSSFFYVFTGMHALHVLGGIAALVLLLRRVLKAAPLGAPLMAGVTRYWHFMGALWLYLLFIICTRL